MVPQDLSAVVFLGLVALAVLLWAVVALRRSPYTPVQSILFFVAVLLARLLWRGEMPPQLPLQRGQGAVVICNHRSSADPCFLQIPAGQPIHWLVAREYYESRLLGWLLRICEVIPVGRRGVDTAATKAAIRLASQGGLIGIFPEGRINQSDEFLLPARSGAAWIALKARVPILPCYIEEAPYGERILSPLLMPARVRMRCGPPIDLSPYYGRDREPAVIAEVMQRAMAEIAKLAGRQDYQPQVAGRGVLR